MGLENTSKRMSPFAQKMRGISVHFCVNVVKTLHKNKRFRILTHFRPIRNFSIFRADPCVFFQPRFRRSYLKAFERPFRRRTTGGC